MSEVPLHPGTLAAYRMMQTRLRHASACRQEAKVGNRGTSLIRNTHPLGSP